MRYTKELHEQLLEKNQYLQNEAAIKYNDFAAHDPFPEIPDSLLNSEDIIKYVLTTGMIDQFNIEKLAGATYTCDFSGEYFCWSNERIHRCKTLDFPDELIIKPNSITYLAVEGYFRIPLYIALRFNLRVPHVYKGLLLGTGPIVDPNFVGQLYIPLHNLTSNEYVIKKGAGLIDIEFTKLSKSNEWSLTPYLIGIVNNLDFDQIPYLPKPIKEGRKFSEYITRALNEDPLFYKADSEEICVSSSIPEEINKFQRCIDAFDRTLINKSNELDKKIIEQQDKIEQEKKNINVVCKDMRSAERYVKTFISLTLVSVFIGVGALIYAAVDFFNSSYDILNSTKQELQASINQNKTYQEQIKTLKLRIDALELSNAKNKP